MSRFGIVVASISLSALAGCADQARDAAASLSYNWDVRPVLSDNCFACHGPDAESRKAGLRLDQFEAVTAVLPESPGRFAIVPGDADASELIRRITSTDPDVVMPPPDAGKSLSDDQKDVIARWIDEGADYQPHWAYVPPVRTEPPASTFDGEAINAIDRFIFARLEQEGLAPSAEADRATLINRVTLDLTGLPPTLEEVEAFVADDDPAAYEVLVDRLLDSTARAEHMTAQWLDIARFADTDGYLEDVGDRLLYPWRDWVIEAFRDNMPFDGFSTLQIAGDLLPAAGPDELLPTTFMRLGQRSSENGIIEEEYLNEYAIDRVETLGVGYLGHTVGCARCHDHKYDPISIPDFYAFSAFFSSTNEPGFYSPGFVPGIEVGPTLHLPDDATEARLAELSANIETRNAELYAAVEAAAASADRRAEALATREQLAEALERTLDDALAAHYSFDEVYEGSLEFARTGQSRGGNFEQNTDLPAGIDADKVLLTPSNIDGQVPGLIQSPTLGPGIAGQALYFDEENKGYFGGDVGDYDRTDAFSIDFWLYVADVYDDATIINHNQHLRFARTGYTLDFRDNFLRFAMVHSPSNMFAVTSREALEPGEWVHLTVTYDGSSRAEGLSIYANGDPLLLEIAENNLDQTIQTEPQAFIDDTLYGLAFGKRWQQYTIAGSALDEVRVFDRDLTPLEVRFLHDPGTLNPDDAGVRAFITATDPGVLAARAALSDALGAHDQVYSYVPEIMVMGDDPRGRPAFVRNRGVYSDLGERVMPQGLDQIFEWNEALPRDRLGLTQWLFDPENPLTSRVYVNRLWQSLFGTGIVETAEDFGTQGSNPTHPRLLDWLAVEFIDSGWDIRHMQKLLVMSATYRQASHVSDSAREIDPFNRLLSRGVRQRLPAEVIRDNALATGGLLNADIGGPSVFPYQPAGAWSAVTGRTMDDYPAPDEVPVDEHHRRSVYTYVKRAVQHPAMQVFDLGRRTTSIARRRTSNTPLQALVLLNDPQYLEAYEGLAARVLGLDASVEGRVVEMYRMALRREPSEAELAVLMSQYDELAARFDEDDDKAGEYLSAGVREFDIPADRRPEFAALASLARIIMNSPDYYTKR